MNKKNNPKHIDFLYGGVVLLLSILIWFVLIPTQIRTRASYFNDVAMIPRFATLVMASTGLMLIIMRLKDVKNLKAMLSPSSYSINWKVLIKQVLFIALLVGYIKGIPTAGFLLSTFVFTFIMLFYFGSPSPWKNLLISAVFSVVAYFIFSYAFRVSLPSGWLGV